MNWGHKITIVIVSFILIMSGMVYVAMKQTNEMVDKNYYDKELHYQQKIDAARQLDAVSKEPIFEHIPQGLCIQIPPVLVQGFSNGHIELLNNSNNKNDVVLNFTPDTSGKFIIDNRKLATGSYIGRVEWEIAGKRYYREQAVIIP
ncbi:MAG: FixH family protein [Bacteroidota bacterium]